MQLPQVGRSSPHLMRRFRHVRQPVLVRFLILVFAETPGLLPVGERSPPPSVGEGICTLAMGLNAEARLALAGVETTRLFR
jgi:hypothetical protein